MVYNWQEIREMLKECFNGDEIKELASDLFPATYKDFTTGMTLSQMRQMVLDEAKRSGRGSDLCKYVEEKRPDQYYKFADRLIISATDYQGDQYIRGRIIDYFEVKKPDEFADFLSQTIDQSLRQKMTDIQRGKVKKYWLEPFWLFRIDPPPQNEGKFIIRGRYIPDRADGNVMPRDTDLIVIQVMPTGNNRIKFTAVCFDIRLLQIFHALLQEVVLAYAEAVNIQGYLTAFNSQ